ncbi:MAG: patatin-like phospholipase family protein [Betaproteobacteria bacterium]|nr:patatin-like phospholipase family protein [Betaproteobacteria bacterium]
MNFRFRFVPAIAVAWLATAAMLPEAAISAGANESSGSAGGAKRPKICLVLSGGGARGAAHLGVIKVLEEYRVPISCIAGTSMGALFGAAYATGMTVPEMQKIIGALNTEVLFKERPPRAELSMRRKQDDYNFFIGPEIGVGQGELTIGKGLVTGVQLETVLRGLSKAHGFHHFDALPIPFRAVATNLVTGKPVVFSAGELANVMRASMSVPGAIAPAEYGGMMLVDGMLTSNLPVETARAMGADIIIAVNAGTPLLKREQLTGILGVAGQMFNILTEQNVQASLALLKPTDILISPEMEDISTADFDHLEKIAPFGEAAARQLGERLAQLSLPPGEYAALRASQTNAIATDLRPADEIRFEKMQRVNPQTAKALMLTQAGQPIDQQTLNRDMRHLYGTGYFEHVNYRFIEEAGKRVLTVNAIEKTWGPDTIRLGLGLSTDFTPDAYFNIIGSYRKSWINSLGAEWRTDLQFGRTSSLLSEFYQPLNAEGIFFVAPHVALERRGANLYQGDQVVARYDTTSDLVGVDIGSQFKRYGEMRIGLVRGVFKPKLVTGTENLSPGPSHISQGALTARLVFDQVDSAYFPRSGWRGGLSLFHSNTRLGADNGYTKWDTDGSASFSFGEHTLNLSAKIGGKVGANPLPRHDQFQWGGFLQQSGYRTGQLYGEKLVFGRALYYQRIFRGGFFEGAYGGMSLELGKVGNPLVTGSPDGLLKSASIFVAADSPIGPAYLGYGRAQDGANSFYFYLGKPF